MPNTNLSVVIPTYGRTKALKRAINSVLNQTLLPEELIVVDDGNQPPLEEKIFDAGVTGLETKILRNKTSRGAANARNAGLRFARSRWVAFLDDDDAFFPEKIETIARSIQENPEVDLIYHPAEICMAKEQLSYRSGVCDLTNGKDVLRQLLIRNEVGGTSMTILKRKTLLELGGFDETMPALEDWELWIRVAKTGGRFLFVDKMLTRYHHDNSIRSLTKDYNKTGRAINILQQNYAGDYARLSPKNRKQFNKGKLQSEMFQALLNQDYKGAKKKQFQVARLSKHPLEFFKFLGLVVWPGGVFTLRSHLQKFLQ